MKYLITCTLLCTLFAAVNVKPTMAHAAATVQQEIDSPSDRFVDNEVSTRVDVTHTFSDDSQSTRHLSFTDLRLSADAAHVFAAPLELHFDWRGRKGWDGLTTDKLSATDAYVQLGERGDWYRLKLGRQQIREISGAAVDGVTAELHFDATVHAMVFAGMQPHPFSDAFNTDFFTAGAAYAFLAPMHNHSGGLMLSTYHDGLDRIFLSQRSYMYFSRALQVSGFAIVDLMAPQAMLPYIAERSAGADLTALHLQLRLRPLDWLDAKLAVSHNHTVLPNKWWHDWLAQEQQRRGFVIDGVEPLGTRISSVRLTTNFPIIRSLIPYVRLRYDYRHTQEAHGGEAKLGIKSLLDSAYIDTSYAYRRYFSIDGHLLELRGGYSNHHLWGVDAGAMLQYVHPLDNSTDRLAGNVFAMAWLAPAALFALNSHVQVYAQYMGFYEAELVYHVVNAGVSYRY